MRVISAAQHAAQIVDAGAEYRPYRYVLERDSSIRHDESAASETARVLREVFLDPVYADELLAVVVADAAPDVLLVVQMLLAAHAAAESSRLPTAMLWRPLDSQAGQARSMILANATSRGSVPNARPWSPAMRDAQNASATAASP